MRFIKHDGGRSLYYPRSPKGDCCARAIAIATNTDYQQVWEELCDIAKPLGMFPNENPVWQRYLTNRGWKQHKLPKPWQGIANLALSQAIVYCRAGYQVHLTAIKNGDLYDTWDCRDRLAYSYWSP